MLPRFVEGVYQQSAVIAAVTANVDRAEHAEHHGRNFRHPAAVGYAGGGLGVKRHRAGRLLFRLSRERRIARVYRLRGAVTSLCLLQASQMAVKVAYFFLPGVLTFGMQTFDMRHAVGFIPCPTACAMAAAGVVKNSRKRACRKAIAVNAHAAEGLAFSLYLVGGHC